MTRLEENRHTLGNRCSLGQAGTVGRGADPDPRVSRTAPGPSSPRASLLMLYA